MLLLLDYILHSNEVKKKMIKIVKSRVVGQHDLFSSDE